jgi:hypothetical protein
MLIGQRDAVEHYSFIIAHTPVIALPFLIPAPVIPYSGRMTLGIRS